jgi:hypothetical protein
MLLRFMNLIVAKKWPVRKILVAKHSRWRLFSHTGLHCIASLAINPMILGVAPLSSNKPEPMKKTLLSIAALMIAFATIGCQPADTTTDVSTDVVVPEVDSNVTATAETPAVVETPVVEEEVPAATEPAVEEEPAAE